MKNKQLYNGYYMSRASITVRNDPNHASCKKVSAPLLQRLLRNVQISLPEVLIILISTKTKPEGALSTLFWSHSNLRPVRIIKPESGLWFRFEAFWRGGGQWSGSGNVSEEVSIFFQGQVVQNRFSICSMSFVRSTFLVCAGVFFLVIAQSPSSKIYIMVHLSGRDKLGSNLTYCIKI